MARTCFRSIRTAGERKLKAICVLTAFDLFSVDPLPFVTMGSGSLAAMAVFESRFKEGMEREEAMKLVHDAIESGIVNDLGSGSNVDLMVITRGKIEKFRNVDTSHSEKKYKLPGGFQFPRGTTEVIKTTHVVTPIVGAAGAHPMDVTD